MHIWNYPSITLYNDNFRSNLGTEAPANAICSNACRHRDGSWISPNCVTAIAGIPFLQMAERLAAAEMTISTVISAASWHSTIAHPTSQDRRSSLVLH
ncbi:hypothetical protein [Rhodococcus aetherivorans]|uniref:hypothetical protein n=1 Tax=Rhodococcus aetherivorans TaxID=191292 RepID=UPI00163A72D9|nr:hypothetical protein [Rhodococcus aetherivorans]MBC2592455.1 hypothetical protein [Rhodococcus aetherivorans]